MGYLSAVFASSPPMQSLTTFAALLLASVVLVPLFKRAGSGDGARAIWRWACLIGPFGVSWCATRRTCCTWPSSGVVLLLFLIGLELEPRACGPCAARSSGWGRAAAGLALVLAGRGCYWGCRRRRRRCGSGIILALSSTAFVLQVMLERGELSTATGARPSRSCCSRICR